MGRKSHTARWQCHAANPVEHVRQTVTVVTSCWCGANADALYDSVVGDSDCVV